MFEGITLAALMLDGAKIAATLAVPITIILSLLPEAWKRFRLVRYWALLPAGVGIFAIIAGCALGTGIILLGLMLLVCVAPTWFALSMGTNFLIVRLRRLFDDLDARHGR